MKQSTIAQLQTAKGTLIGHSEVHVTGATREKTIAERT